MRDILSVERLSDTKTGGWYFVTRKIRITLFLGIDVVEALRKLYDGGATIVGLNCSLGPMV